MNQSSDKMVKQIPHQKVRDFLLIIQNLYTITPINRHSGLDPESMLKSDRRGYRILVRYDDVLILMLFIYTFGGRFFS